MKQVIFMIGAPAAGKSTTRQKLFPTYPVIDPDEIKKGLDGYDPKKPWLVHSQSKKISREMFVSYLEKGVSFVYDTTGGNVERMTKEIGEAKEKGYQIILLHVSAPLNECLKRNRQRERTVPDSVVIEIWNEVQTSFRILKHLSDVVIEVDTTR
jgi:predicted kinase